jgi:hypothetical protein
MTPGAATQTSSPQPDIAEALRALIASPIGALFAALLPHGVVDEIGSVLARAVTEEATAREAAAEAQRALVARAEADRLRADAAEVRLKASDDETARLRSCVSAAEAETARLKHQFVRICAQLDDIAGAVADTISTIDAAGGARGLMPDGFSGPATADCAVGVRWEPSESESAEPGSCTGPSPIAEDEREPRDAMARDTDRGPRAAAKIRAGGGARLPVDPAVAATG